MKNVYANWLSLSGLKSVGVSTPPESKGWVAINGAHVFIGGSGGGGGTAVIAEDGLQTRRSPKCFQRCLRQGVPQGKSL